jgi:hypothetical protein
MMDHHSQPPGIDSLGRSGPIDAEMDDQNVMFLKGPVDLQGGICTHSPREDDQLMACLIVDLLCNRQC